MVEYLNGEFTSFTPHPMKEINFKLIKQMKNIIIVNEFQKLTCRDSQLQQQFVAKAWSFRAVNRRYKREYVSEYLSLEMARRRDPVQK